MASFRSLVVLAFLPVGGASNCTCTGVNMGVDTAVYGRDYGQSCKAWEDGVTYGANTRSCSSYDESERGMWCCRAWCYIDPLQCDGVQTPFYASFIQTGTNQALYYSYAHCDQTEKVVEEAFDTETCPWQGGNSEYTPSFAVTTILRDFSDRHPHFGCGSGCSDFFFGHRPGMVESSLDASGRPKLASGSQADEEKFREWYSKPYTATERLTFMFDTSSGNHVFDSTDYMPLGAGNGLFTSEMRVFFRYNGGEVFSFRGDDDVWIFINGQLVGDIGGCHGAIQLSVSLDSVAARINISKNQNYELALFHAERCYGSSNFMARMTIRQDQGVCPNQCNSGDGLGHCDLATGRCVCCPGWGGADCATPMQDYTRSGNEPSSCGDPTFIGKAHGPESAGHLLAFLFVWAAI